MVSPVSQLVSRIQSELANLRTAEAKVARVILADPDRAIRSSLATTAASAGVSEPTVIRFCRRMGFDGYPDFKIGLAQDLAAGVPYVSPHISAGDDTAIYMAKIFSSTVSAIQSTANGLRAEQVASAVVALAGAQRITIFGVGGSSAVAFDTYHKLMRLNIHCQQSSDPVLARMLVPAMRRGDILLALSYTGRTLFVLDLVRLARERGISVIGITSAGSRLAAEADIALTVPSAEDSDMFTPMAARIAMLAIVDVLATGLALTRSATAMERLAAIKDLLRDTRYPVEEPETLSKG